MQLSIHVVLVRVDGPWSTLSRWRLQLLEKIKEFLIVGDVNVGLTMSLPFKHSDRVEFHLQEGGYEGLRRLMA